MTEAPTDSLNELAIQPSPSPELFGDPSLIRAGLTSETPTSSNVPLPMTNSSHGLVNCRTMMRRAMLSNGANGHGKNARRDIAASTLSSSISGVNSTSDPRRW